jgi:hypothetical protein
MKATSTWQDASGSGSGLHVRRNTQPGYRHMLRSIGGASSTEIGDKGG